MPIVKLNMSSPVCDSEAADGKILLNFGTVLANEDQSGYGYCIGLLQRLMPTHKQQPITYESLQLT